MPGALVTLKSFLETNPWFDGDVVIMASEEFDLSQLRALWPKTSMGGIGDAFWTGIKYATEESLRKTTNLLKGEALLLTGFDRLLFVDADMLFRGSVLPALDSTAAVVAPPDRASLKGLRRSKRDYRIDHAERDGPLAHSFCSGFMILNASALGATQYQEFIGHLSRITREPLPDGLSDQAIFNLMFQDAVHPLEPSYNYLVRSPELMPLPIEDARIVHFSAIAKPWDPVNAFEAMQRGSSTAQAYAWWQESWRALNRPADM